MFDVTVLWCGAGNHIATSGTTNVHPLLSKSKARVEVCFGKGSGCRLTTRRCSNPTNAGVTVRALYILGKNTTLFACRTSQNRRALHCRHDLLCCGRMSVGIRKRGQLRQSCLCVSFSGESFFGYFVPLDSRPGTDIEPHCHNRRFSTAAATASSMHREGTFAL